MTTERWVGRHSVDVRMLLKWTLNSVWRCLRLRSCGDLLCSWCWTLRSKARCEYGGLSPELHKSMARGRSGVWIFYYGTKCLCVLGRDVDVTILAPRIVSSFLGLFNPLTPNDNYSGRTATLTSKRCILYTYSTNIGTEYFKHGIYSPFFLFKMQFVS